MNTPPRPRRLGPDACPGVLSVWQAQDGGLARVRLPGGRLASSGLRVLAEAATELGSGVLELTVRGNMQVRGLARGAERDLAERLRPAGLLPSDTHERVRNIVASPCSGLCGPEVWAVVAALDAAMIAEADLAALPGRFLFAVDDGTCDVTALGADVALFRGERSWEVVLGGTVPGVRVAEDQVVVAAVCAARAFLTERQAQGSGAWRLVELTEGPARVAAVVRAAIPTVHCAESLPPGALVRPRLPNLGPHATPLDGRVAVVVGVPDRTLSAQAAGALVDSGAAESVRVTPWRSLLVPGLDCPGVDIVRSWAGAHGLEVV
ncbi:MAG TPA: precorrin-3B synthase [Sporichthyaceae bacterium]|jgi:precorrin-3B synthase|nr:precorrin-3B synthase [Sporichthyaceae bacterium]